MVSDHIVRHHSDAPFGPEPSDLISFSKNRKNVPNKLFALLVTFLKNLKNRKNVSKKMFTLLVTFPKISNMCQKKIFTLLVKNPKNVPKKCLDFS